MGHEAVNNFLGLAPHGGIDGPQDSGNRCTLSFGFTGGESLSFKETVSDAQNNIARFKRSFPFFPGSTE
jgi:hypothetical protein